MAYKLTITDLETGKIEQEKVCDGIMCATFSREQDPMQATNAFFFEHNLTKIEVISLLISWDDIRESLFKEDPYIALGYHLRDKIFRHRVVIDINGLEKQFGAK